MIEVIILSMKVASIATLLTFLSAIAIAKWMDRENIPGKEWLESLFILPMVLPPSVTGFVLLKILGKNGYIGKLLESIWGIRLLFTWQAAVIAAAVVSFPIMYQSCKAALLTVDKSIENVARTLGAKEWTVFWKVTLPMAFPSIMSGIVLSFARAVGEFGATLMIGGNIAGETRTIPVAIFFATESGNQKMALTLTWVVLIYGLVVVYGLNRWLRVQNRQRGESYDRI